jgi:hypothetical protein
MVVDPEFNDIGKNKSKPKTGWSWLRWLLVNPLLWLAGCHMLMTGSPIPLWQTDSLNQPVRVKQVTETALILADGRSVSLPFIKRIPKNDAVFLTSLKHGVEVEEDGEVVGLITIYPDCGNDPYRWRTERINLSHLAGYMDPDGIDDSIVSVEVIDDLKKNENRSLDRHGLPYSLMTGVSRVRQVYNGVNEQPNLNRTFGVQQADQ